MKKILNILLFLFITFVSNAQYKVEDIPENWVLIQDSLNYEYYAGNNKTIRVYYETKMKETVKIIRFTMRKESYDMIGMMQRFNKKLEPSPYFDRVWYDRSSQGVYKVQMIEHGKHDKMFSIISQRMDG